MSHSSMTEKLALAHVVELREVRRPERRAPRRKQATLALRGCSGRLLISLGTRLSSEEVRATNRGSKLVGN